MKIFIKTTILFFSIFFIRCSDDNPVEPIDKTFKLNFINSYNAEEGWVILHSEDGQSTISTKKFYGDATIDFGEIEQEKVTFTYIYTERYGETKYYYINSIFSAQKGNWTFDGRNYSYKGNLNVKLSYPSGDYDYCFLGTNNFSTIRILPSGVTNRYTFSEREMYYLNSEQKLSLYGSVYNFETGIAYYGWLPNQSFDIGEVNSYNLNLTTLMQPSSIKANREFDYVSIYAAPFNTKDRIKLFSSYYNNDAEQQKVFYPTNFTAIKFRTIVSNRKENYKYSYSKFGDKVYTDLNIPKSTITATYDENQKSFYNISTTGNFDIITAYWSYYNGNDNKRYTWYISFDKNKISAQRPIMPTEILDEIYSFDISKLKPYYISILDYDTASSYDEILSLWYKRNKNLYESVNESYFYRMEIN